MMRMRTFGAVVMTAALMVAGCASGRAAPTAGPAAPTTPTTQAPPADTSPTSPTPDPQSLKSALLTADDLGTSFSVTPKSAGPNGGAGSGCPALDAAAGPISGNQAQDVDFTGAEGRVFLTEALAGGTPADVSAAYAKIQSALAACQTWTVTTGGTTVTLTPSPISFGGAGSAAVRLDGTSRGTEVNGYVVVEELGTVLLGYSYFQVGSGSSQLAYYEFTQAQAKAERVLGVAPDAATKRA
jgi:hypothetical protein